MDKEYKVTIELHVTANGEHDAYIEACRYIKAEQLSRELCTIEIDS